MEEVSSFLFKVLKLFNIDYLTGHLYIFLFTVLATWFLLKYPHVPLGSLASSAPILYFDDITPQNGYYAVVTKDFRVRC